MAIFWDLQPLWSSLLTKPDLLRFRCSCGHVLSKTKSVTPHFFYISDIANSSSFHGKIFRKKSMLEKFRANVLKCARARCKTCPFICNVEKLSGPKRSIKITDHFTCTSANVIYCITCTLCKKLYIGETSTLLGDRFREHLRDVEKDDKNASKPVARHFNLPNHSMQHMTVCGLSLHQGNTESRKTLEQKFIFQIGTLNPDGINERFSFN